MLWLSVVFAFMLISVSCKQKETASNSDYSAAFNSIYHDNRVYVKNAEQGMYFLDSAFRHLSSATRNDTFRYYSMHFMYNKRMAHNTAKELLYADSMMAVASRCIHEKQYINFFSEANFAKGDAYFDVQQYNEAYKYFYEGYFLGKNHFNDEILAEYTYRMAMIAFKQSHFKIAANYFKDTYRRLLRGHDGFATFYQKQEVLNDIGESYQQNGDVDSASLYFGKALAFINANDNKYKDKANLLEIARAVTYGDQGAIAYKKGQYAQAEDAFKKSIAINLIRFNDNYNAEVVEISLAQLYLDQHKDAAFMDLMRGIHSQLDSIKNMDAETDWNRLMSSYYAAQKDFAQSLNYFKKYSSLKDSLNKAASSLKETDINQQLANYDKQYQIQNLKDNNKLQQIYLFLAVIGVVMAVVIIFLVHRNWERSKRDVLAIGELNKQINLQKTDLENTLHELKVNSQEKDRILRTVAHDLRNPIGGIVALTNAMLDDEYSDEQKQLINLVNSTSGNSLELINEILEATNTTNEKLSKESVEINSLVSNSVEILSFKAAEKNQKIITELLDHPQKLMISRERIWRVISNLISNAIKFSPNGAAIDVKVTNGAGSINISVSDNGIGIPDDIKDEVFNIFTNAKRPGTAGEKSFGLGLSICQQIIENHHGKIWFESKVNAGTTFHISLPAA
jgi:signal transduction histidine kinase